MHPDAEVRSRLHLTGRILSGLAILFLLLDSVMKLLVLAPVTESFARFGFAGNPAVGIGLLELLCTVVYAVPRTARHGAVLLTGFLGGAIATHLRVDDPWLSHTLFPLYVGALIWGGLLLRDPTTRGLLLGGTQRVSPQR